MYSFHCCLQFQQFLSHALKPLHDLKCLVHILAVTVKLSLRSI